MAVFNLVLAIATRHSSLMRKEPEGGTGTHMSYFTRALQLCMRNYAVFDHPNLQQVQVESLMSLYMLSIGHVNGYVYPTTALLGLGTDDEQGVADVRRRNEISSGHGNPPS